MGGSHRIPNIGKIGERVVASSRLENGDESVRFRTNRVVTLINETPDASYSGRKKINRNTGLPAFSETLYIFLGDLSLDLASFTTWWSKRSFPRVDQIRQRCPLYEIREKRIFAACSGT